MQHKFDWTTEMGRWLDGRTSTFTFKSIAFQQLVEDAEQLWGLRAPPQEVLENKIKSRDNARKKGYTVKWILDYESEDATR